MQTEKYKKHIRLSFGLGLLFTILILIAFWNAFFRKEELVAGILPFFFGALAISSFTYMYINVLKATDSTSLNNYLEEKIRVEKAQILSELNREDETEETEEDDADIEDIIKALMPGGSFKKADTFGKKMLSNLAKQFNLGQAILYMNETKSKKFSFLVGYGLTSEEPIPDFIEGDGLNGEAVKSQKVMVIEDIPEEYFSIETGLGGSQPGFLVILPVLFKKKVIAVIEMASFSPINAKNINILEKFSDIVSSKLNQLFKA